MAFQEGTGSSKHFIVKSLAPDWCKSPGSPVAYDVVAFLNESAMTSPNVNFKGVPVFDMASRVTTVWGDEPGIGGGVKSGVNKGFCKPITPVTTVRCNGFMTCRHEHTMFEMNGASPEGPFNTIGKVMYLGAQGPGPVTPAGGVPMAANSIVASQAPGELSCLPKLDQLTSSVGGLEDIVGYAQKAYDLSKVDWSNPMAALGAIGGVAGMAGFDGVANMANKAGQLMNLANTDFSDPAALMGAIGGAAGMAGMSDMARLAQLGSGLANVELDNPGSIVGGLSNLAGMSRDFIASDTSGTPENSGLIMNFGPDGANGVAPARFNGENLAENARNDVGKEDWSQDSKHKHAGSGDNKCNLYIYDKLKEAGTDVGTRERDTLGCRFGINPAGQCNTPPTTTEWRTPEKRPPGFGEVSEREAKPGDIHLIDRGPNQSGHMGIVVENDGSKITTVSAGEHKVVEKVPNVNKGENIIILRPEQK